MGTLSLGLILMLTASAVGVMGFISQAHAEVSLHVSLVVDSEVGTDGRGTLFRVDPSTGERKLLSDFGVGEPRGFGPVDLAIDPSGNILVVDANADINGREEFKGALFRIDPFACNPPSEPCKRTVISDFGDPDLGPLGETPIDVAIDTSGRRFVIDSDAGTDRRGALFRIVRRCEFVFGIPVPGTCRFIRILISDFGVGDPLGIDPVSLAIDAAGNIVVTDSNADVMGTGQFKGALFRIDPSACNPPSVPCGRTVISDFGNPDQGPPGDTPLGVAIVKEGFVKGGATGSILVIDSDAGMDARGALFRVDPATGQRRLISDFGIGEPRGRDPSDLAVDGFGNIQVIDNAVEPTSGEIGRGALFSIDPSACNPPSTLCKRTVISDFNDDTKGPVGLLAQGVGIVPVPLVVDVDANNENRTSGCFNEQEQATGGRGAGALFSVDPFTGAHTVLHNFNVADTTQDPPVGLSPTNVDIEGPDSILIVDLGAGPNKSGVLFRINPSICNRPPCQRTVVCNGIGVNPLASAMEAPGQILVSDSTAGTKKRGALLRVDTSTCGTTVVSDFGNSRQGRVGSTPGGVAIEDPTCILVADSDAGKDENGILFRVNLFTPFVDENRTVLSDFNRGKPEGVDPVRVAIEASQDLLVIDRSAGERGKGALFRVDPRTGERRLISNFGDRAQGELGEDPNGIAIEASGNVLVTDVSVGRRGVLFRVDPRSGQRRPLSDFQNPTKGSSLLGACPTGVAVTLTPTKVNLFPVIIP
jgi:hypothetical protein